MAEKAGGLQGKSLERIDGLWGGVFAAPARRRKFLAAQAIPLALAPARSVAVSWPRRLHGRGRASAAAGPRREHGRRNLRRLGGRRLIRAAAPSRPNTARHSSRSPSSPGPWAPLLRRQQSSQPINPKIVNCIVRPCSLPRPGAMRKESTRNNRLSASSHRRNLSASRKSPSMSMRKTMARQGPTSRVRVAVHFQEPQRELAQPVEHVGCPFLGVGLLRQAFFDAADTVPAGPRCRGPAPASSWRLRCFLVVFSIRSLSGM